MGMITHKSDGENARIAAAREAERIQREIRHLESQGMFGAAERLQAEWERADLGSETWGECYLLLLGVKGYDKL